MHIVHQVTNFFIDSFQELKKVAWPKRADAIQHTLYVIIAVVVAAVVVSSIDILLTKLIERLLA